MVTAILMFLNQTKLDPSAVFCGFCCIVTNIDMCGIKLGMWLF